MTGRRLRWPIRARLAALQGLGLALIAAGIQLLSLTTF